MPRLDEISQWFAQSCSIVHRYCCDRTFDELLVINEDRNLVEKWLNGNKLSLNVLKSHSMLISTKPKHKTLESNNEYL